MAKKKTSVSRSVRTRLMTKFKLTDIMIDSLYARLRTFFFFTVCNTECYIDVRV